MVQAQADRAKAAIETAEAILALSTLTASQDATVVSVDVIPGEFVEQGQTVMTLATIDQLQLETTDLSERDITKVKVDAPVSISIEALNKTFNGEVISISPEVTLSRPRLLLLCHRCHHSPGYFSPMRLYHCGK